SPPAEGSESDRLRNFLGQTVRAFQVQPQFYKMLLVVQMTSDPYAAEIYVSLDQGFRRIFDAALGPTAESDRDHDAIFVTLECVLSRYLTRWVMGRCSIEDVYAAVYESIRLIYEFPQAAGEAGSASERAGQGAPPGSRRQTARSGPLEATRWAFRLGARSSTR